MNYPEITYKSDDGISFDEFFTLGIFEKKNRKYYYDGYNLILGNAQGIPFHASNLEITYSDYSPNENSNNKCKIIRTAYLRICNRSFT